MSHVTEGVTSLGDIALGVGHAVRRNFLANHGLAIRGAVRLPTGDDDALTGAGGVSAAIWAETSGRLFGAGDWLYGAALGALAASTPDAMGTGGLVAFGRFGVTWRALDRLALTAQIDVNSTPYRSALAPLAGPAILLGFGGRVQAHPPHFARNRHRRGRRVATRGSSGFRRPRRAALAAVGGGSFDTALRAYSG